MQPFLLTPFFGAMLAAVFLAGSPSVPMTDNTPQPSSWKTLFDGTSTGAWRGYKTPGVPAGWKVENGELSKTKPVGDLVSKEQFGDFELELEWKVGPGGNSGIFIRGNEKYDYIYWTAPEMQVLDDARHRDGKNRLTSAGSAYGLYAPPAGVVKPANEWNAVRIIARGPHVEHWLNGQKVLEYELWSPEWEAKVKASKFSAWPEFGRLKQGHLALQGDHEGELAFRNIRIRTL